MTGKTKQAFFSVLFLAGCCTTAPSDLVTIRTSAGATLLLTVELAKTPAERAQGLMNRTELPEGRGMLFIFPEDSQSPFWMKDTPISLDLIFVGADGIVVDIAEEAVPFSEELISSESPYRYVIELPAGTVQKNGIKKEDFVELPEVKGVSAAPRVLPQAASMAPALPAGSLSA